MFVEFEENVRNVYVNQKAIKNLLRRHLTVRRLEKRKGRRKVRIYVLNRFWFKRDPSPSAEDELEKHLDKLRIQVRKEIHTLLYLNNAVIDLLRNYAAKLDDKDRQVWDEFINYIETKHDNLLEEPTEYNNIKLKRLEANPESMEALKKLKLKKLQMRQLWTILLNVRRKSKSNFLVLYRELPV
ncbi:hypothetical protein X798_03667 [Onchocerca flexuosa]|uniref:Uncharacterized protein n=1 Tax=Onchocerca flexuosa TaxID=387005 RepID=A0A238BWN1_9BILA|nr:hypothetical protein X798_03667 [Onchocerca flexuosa]